MSAYERVLCEARRIDITVQEPAQVSIQGIYGSAFADLELVN